MTRIVVDTNIIFSCLLNTQGTIGDLLFNSGDSFAFYSCRYMRTEISRHWQKLLSISKLSDEQLQTSFQALTDNIQFVSEDLIPSRTWLAAEQLVASIDPDDVDFVALTLYL